MLGQFHEFRMRAADITELGGSKLGKVGLLW